MGEPGKPSAVPLVVAVVLTWNEYAETAECLRSLANATYPRLEVILVDNASDDGSGERLRGEFGGIRTIRLSENRGYSAGNNAGIRSAMERGADYILIMNNDVAVTPDFLEPLVEVAGRAPENGLVTGKVYYKSDPTKIYSAGGYISLWKCSGVNGRQWEREAEPDPSEGESEISFANGCLVLVRRSVFEECGLLAEHFFLYFDDIEFSRRVAPKFKMFYTPLSRVYHRSGAGVGWGSYTTTYLYHHTRSRVLAFRDDGPGYRTYVLLFTLANVLVKSAVITALHIMEGRPRAAGEKVSSLWRGLVDGITGGGPRG